MPRIDKIRGHNLLKPRLQTQLPQAKKNNQERLVTNFGQQLQTDHKSNDSIELPNMILVD